MNHPYPIAYVSWLTWHPWQSRRQARADRWPHIIETAYQAYIQDNQRSYHVHIPHFDSNDFGEPLSTDLYILWHSGHNYSSEGCAILNVIYTFRGAPPQRRDLDVFYIAHLVDLNVHQRWRPFLREDQLWISIPVLATNCIHRNEVDALYEELEVQLFTQGLPLPQTFPTFATAQRLMQLSERANLD